MTQDEIYTQMGEERKNLYNPSLLLPNLITTISPNDKMYDDHYFDVGYSALNAIEFTLLAAGKEKNEVNDILDLPCGHGRVLRILKAAFPQANLSACDLDHDGVKFCSKTFDATPIYSKQNIESLTISSKFDLVWVGSLFTHLDADDWVKFMKLFRSILNPGGILILTTEGQVIYRLIEGGNLCGLDKFGAKKLLRNYRRKGFGYANYKKPFYAFSKTDKKNKAKYGTTIVKRSWMSKFLENYPDLKQLTYTERGWVRRQDVVSLQKIKPF